MAFIDPQDIVKVLEKPKITEEYGKIYYDFGKFIDVFEK